jgi:hypothetical protein
MKKKKRRRNPILDNIFSTHENIGILEIAAKYTLNVHEILRPTFLLPMTFKQVKSLIHLNIK